MKWNFPAGNGRFFFYFHNIVLKRQPFGHLLSPFLQYSRKNLFCSRPVIHLLFSMFIDRQSFYEKKNPPSVFCEISECYEKPCRISGVPGRKTVAKTSRENRAHSMIKFYAVFSFPGNRMEYNFFYLLFPAVLFSYSACSPSGTERRRVFLFISDSHKRVFHAILHRLKNFLNQQQE